MREIIASVNKKEYPTFSNPKAINRHIIPLISKLLHIATSREISDKAGGGNKNYVSLQKGHSFQVVIAGGNTLCLPVKDIGGRINYQEGGFYNFVGTEIGGQITLGFPSDKELEEYSNLPANRGDIEYTKDDFPTRIALTKFGTSPGAKIPRSSDKDKVRNKNWPKQVEQIKLQVNKMKKILKHIGANIDGLQSLASYTEESLLDYDPTSGADDFLNLYFNSREDGKLTIDEYLQWRESLGPRKAHVPNFSLAESILREYIKRIL